MSHIPVSYTHLDVYKRQSLDSVRFYILSKNENKRVEVIGVETAYKVEEALII